MIPNFDARQLESSGITETGKFSISLEDETHLITMLRDTVYTDKVQAILREYSANAWDAHREVGKFDLPIKVTLPTGQDPTLYIQDFGPGLSNDDVFNVFTKYGKSTKRTSGVSVGMLGIGSKSGFCYSDSFTVTSRHEGMCRTYVALLDETNQGTMNLLSEVECGDDTGITIQIPVRTEDIWEFRQKAVKLFQYFRPHPEINVTLPEIPSEELTLKNGSILEGTDGWVAVMGCVPYRVNIDQLKGPAAESLMHYIGNLSGALYFDIGQVQISASREELKYSKMTKEALITKFNDLIEEYVLHTMKLLSEGNATPWEKRVQAQTVTRMGLPIPKQYRDLTTSTVDLAGHDATTGDFKTFKVIKSGGSQCQKIVVSSSTRFIVRDEVVKNLTGYNLDQYAYIVDPLLNKTTAEIRVELEEVIQKSGLVGIPKVDLSTLPWYPPSKKFHGHADIRTSNPKHQTTAFKLKDGAYRNRGIKSENWEISKHVRTDKDVFVIIKSFNIQGSVTIGQINGDRELIEGLGGTMPPIYGYKSTLKKPLTKDKCQGVHYEDWRIPFIMSLATPKIQKQLLRYQWSVSATDSSYGFNKHNYMVVAKALGENHPLSQLLENVLDATALFKKTDTKTKNAITKLYEVLKAKDIPTVPELEWANIFKRYPLFALSHVPLSYLWTRDEDHEVWLDYVRTCDKALGDL